MPAKHIFSFIDWTFEIVIALPTEQYINRVCFVICQIKMAPVQLSFADKLSIALYNLSTKMGRNWEMLKAEVAYESAVVPVVCTTVLLLLVLITVMLCCCTRKWHQPQSCQRTDWKTALFRATTSSLLSVYCLSTVCLQIFGENQMDNRCICLQMPTLQWITNANANHIILPALFNTILLRKINYKCTRRKNDLK